jgi:hypothetical protein
MTNFAPFGPPPGTNAVTGLWYFPATGGIGPLTWVWRGFGGATLGASTFTGLETGIIVVAGSIGNVAWTTAAWETGVGIGSAIDAGAHCLVD